MCLMRLFLVWANADETDETVHWESGMRYHLPTTTSWISVRPRSTTCCGFASNRITKSNSWTLIGTLQLRSLARPAPVGPTRAGAVNRLELRSVPETVCLGSEPSVAWAQDVPYG
jgi:hypothetical protein